MLAKLIYMHMFLFFKIEIQFVARLNFTCLLLSIEMLMRPVAYRFSICIQHTCLLCVTRIENVTTSCRHFHFNCRVAIGIDAEQRNGEREGERGRRVMSEREERRQKAGCCGKSKCQRTNIADAYLLPKIKNQP